MGRKGANVVCVVVVVSPLANSRNSPFISTLVLLSVMLSHFHTSIPVAQEPVVLGRDPVAISALWNRFHTRPACAGSLTLTTFSTCKRHHVVAAPAAATFAAPKLSSASGLRPNPPASTVWEKAGNASPEGPLR